MPDSVLDPAKKLLRKSEHGKEIADFMDNNKIKIQYSNSLSISADAGYDWKNHVILLPMSAGKSTTHLATLLAHEGFHAMEQDMGMRPSADSEVDANFMQRVVYYEMLKAGAPKVPGGSQFETQYRAFYEQVKTGDYEAFKTDVQKAYSKDREDQLNSATEKMWGPLRGPFRAALVFFDAPFLRPNETLAYQEKRLVNILRKDEFKTAEAEHARQSKWESQWIKDHQEEFLKGSRP
ncbi:MAG: hypothetical protein HY922_11600 [Elusimicrobia bacterium]|nr:hypothetical protein [Elusimicrobiota bacterium]